MLIRLHLPGKERDSNASEMYVCGTLTSKVHPDDLRPPSSTKASESVQLLAGDCVQHLAVGIQGKPDSALSLRLFLYIEKSKVVCKQPFPWLYSQSFT